MGSQTSSARRFGVPHSKDSFFRSRISRYRSRRHIRIRVAEDIAILRNAGSLVNEGVAVDPSQDRISPTLMGSHDFEPSSLRYVLFVDILGFAALTLQHRTFKHSSFDHLDPPNPLRELTAAFQKTEVSPLEMQFALFHDTISRLVDRRFKSRIVTTIAFSDSAFIACEGLEDILSLAIDMMRDLLIVGVPVRIGIARGGFRVLRFRSDVTVSVGFHSAQFTGAGVVYAYRTESSGYKGLRIILHDSVQGHLRVSRQWLSLPQVVELPRLPHHDAGASDFAELSYLLDGDEDYEHIVGRVQALHDEAPEKYRFQYVDTLQALAVMRGAHRLIRSDVPPQT
jgi:hypothetical protein